MNNGIYEYENEINPYDTGTLIVEVKETENSLQLKVIEKDMIDSTYVEVLFRDKENITINKQRSPHNLTCGNGWFIVYPNRMGIPLSFVKKGSD